MDRVLVGVAGIMYTCLIVFLALAFVLFSSNLHAPFLDTETQQVTDKQITQFLLFQGELPAMTENEASHMEDVAWLATTLLYFIAGFIAILTFMFAHAHAEERQAILLSPLLILLSLQLPIILFFENFTIAFEKFHQVFFPQGNYAFPYDSVLISTYPETFFANMTLLIGLFIIGFFFFGLFIALLTQIHQRMQHVKRLGRIHPGLQKLIDEQILEEKEQAKKEAKKNVAVVMSSKKFPKPQQPIETKLSPPKLRKIGALPKLRFTKKSRLEFHFRRLFSLLLPAKTPRKFYSQYSYKKLTKKQKEIEDLVLAGILDKNM